MNHTIYIRRRGKAVPPASDAAELLPLEAAATLSQNLEGLGYALSPDLLNACRRLSLGQLAQFQRDLVAALTPLLGADRPFVPMYLNFPRQVMRASEAELYFNALVHYWSEGQLFPAQRKKMRLRLKAVPARKLLDLGTIEEFEGLFGQIVSANLGFSEQDKEDVGWFVKSYGDDVARLIPESVPQKENVAYLGAQLLKETGIGEAFVRARVRTATDVLRLAVALSGGDVSLAKATKFGAFTRSQRRLLLSLLEERDRVVEDMARWKNRWKRLGEKLHPGEMASRFPMTARAFEVLRNDLPIDTFNRRVEGSLGRADVSAAMTDLRARPGDFARRFDHVLRLDEGRQAEVLAAFRGIASNVSTPVLLQARHHFAVRNELGELRSFFPKGNVAKMFVVPNELPAISPSVSAEGAAVFEEALLERFFALPRLGKTFVDPLLKNYPMPFAVRSASKTLRTLPRGSRVPLPDADTLRMFIWWTNGRERTDIDLSAALFGEGFVYLDTVAYYNLKSYGGVHSGDIVDAPKGASEFIDVSVSRMRHVEIRYVAMVVTSYTRQPYVDLPECFAGWMARAEPDSGEVYEPRTVQDRLDLTADTKAAIPIVFDLAEGTAVWCDMALRHHPNFHNSVSTNLKGIALTMRAMMELNKPNLYDLFSLHARARGDMMDSVEAAETVFSVAAGTPFEIERIGAEFMA